MIEKSYGSGIADYNRMLEGKRVFITTGARGIGRSIGLLFARQGAQVYFAGRNEKWVREAQEEIGAEGGVCRGYLCDLSDAKQSEAAAREVLRDSGGIDILVSTVGVNCHCRADEYKDEDMFRLLETNYLSGLRFARQFAPGMCERGTGSIINISSIHSVLTQPGNMLYAGTKGAMNAAARAMALDYAPYGVRVNTICPGVIMSDVMFDAVDQMKTEEEKEAFWEVCRKCQPLEPGRMADISNTALFLASDMGAYITGQYILVDGGTSIKAHDSQCDS